MKKHLQKFISFIAILFLSITVKAQAVITIQVMGSSFSPDNTNAMVNDTIRWVLNSGSHTTTSTAIPGCATAWDSPINNANTTFDYVIPCAGTFNYECTPHGFTGIINAVVSSFNNLSTNSPVISISPNATNGNFDIKYVVKENSPVRIEMFDVIGKSVAIIINEQRHQGEYIQAVNLKDVLRNGLYFIKTTIGKHQSVQKLIIQ